MWTHREMTQDGGGAFLSRNFFSSSVGYITLKYVRNTNGMISCSVLWCCQLQKIITVCTRMVGLYSVTKYLHLMQDIPLCVLFLPTVHPCTIFCRKNHLGAQIFLIRLLLFSTCFGQICAHYKEKIPYICDAWY